MFHTLLQVLRLQALRLKLSKLGPWLSSVALGHTGRCGHSQNVRVHTSFPNWLSPPSHSPAASATSSRATGPLGHFTIPICGQRYWDGGSQRALGLPCSYDLFLAPLQEGFCESFEVIPNLLVGERGYVMKDEKGSRRLQAHQAGGFLRILPERTQNRIHQSLLWRGAVGGRRGRCTEESGRNRQWRLSREASMTAQA